MKKRQKNFLQGIHIQAAQQKYDMLRCGFEASNARELSPCIVKLMVKSRPSSHFELQ